MSKVSAFYSGDEDESTDIVSITDEVGLTDNVGFTDAIKSSTNSNIRSHNMSSSDSEEPQSVPVKKRKKTTGREKRQSVKKRLSKPIPAFSEAELQEELDTANFNHTRLTNQDRTKVVETKSLKEEVSSDEEDNDNTEKHKVELDSEDDSNKSEDENDNNVPDRLGTLSRSKSSTTKRSKGKALPDPSWWREFAETEPSLDEIQEMVTKVSSTTARNEKLQFLKNYPHCVKILRYCYDPYWQYYLRPIRVQHTLKDKSWHVPSGKKLPNSIFALLDLLKDREITGNEALYTTCWFVNSVCRNPRLSHVKQKQHEQLVYAILDRNLKIRCGVKSLNAVFPTLIPEFSVALAQPLEKASSHAIDYKRDTFVAQRKFDGVRCIALIKKGLVEFRSRTGNLFVTLQLVENCINNWHLPTDESLCLDGELCIVNEDGIEDFKQVVGEIRRRKSGFISNPRYVVFDCLTLKEFEQGTSSRTYLERLDKLRSLLSGKEMEPFVTIAESVKLTDEAHLTVLSEDAEKRGWEGLILRKDCGYVGQRSFDLIKVKKFQDLELRVINLAVGPMRFVIDGRDQEIQTLSYITVDFQGNTVDVGSGFNREERDYYMQNPKKIIGQLATVQYYEISQDKNGKKSLRFPVFRGVVGKKRTI